MKFTSKIILLFGAAAIAVAAAVPEDVQATNGPACWKGCLMNVGKGLNPPCDNAQCACERASEFDGPADDCVRDGCPQEDLQALHCAACHQCGYRCERCPGM